MMDKFAQLRELRQSLPPPTAENKQVREDMLAEARQLMLDLERPENAVERVCYQLVETVIVRTAVKMGLFKVLSRNPTSTTGDLAKACGADPILVGRVLRCLAAFGAIKQFGQDSYGPATTSSTFADRKSEMAMEVCLGLLAPGWLALPTFLEEKGWQNATSYTDTSMAKGWNRKGGSPLWEIIKESGHSEAFNTYMMSFSQGRKDWLDFYPIVQRLGDGADQEQSSVMIVDVGGGYGHQTLNLRQRFPQLPGRFVVQDIPQGLPADRSDEIEYMEHDFTQEQPIKGARLYYLRYITHDWSQEINVQICSQLRKAMKPGYSRLIVHEWIIPELNPSKNMTAMDITMMNVLGGMERTLPLHRDYLEKAGLKITKVYDAGDNISESIIEAEVA